MLMILVIIVFTAEILVNKFIMSERLSTDPFKFIWEHDKKHMMMLN